MNWHKEIATNTLFQIIARVASSGSTFLITILVARHFGLNSFGDFAKVNAFVSLFYLFADFGFNAVFLQKKDAKVRFKDLFYTRFILSAVLVFLVNCVAWFLPYNGITHIGFSEGVRFGIGIFSFTIITESILYTSAAVFQRELSYELLMIASVVGSIATLAFVLAATLTSFSLFYIFLAYVAGGIIEGGLAIFLTREQILPPRIDVSFIKKLTTETLPITLMLIFNLIYFRIDIILLSFMKSSKDVGIYDLSYRFFDFLIALPLFLSNAIYPSIIKSEQENKEYKIRKYLILFVGFSFCVLIPAWFLAPAVGLIKNEFAPTSVPLRILLLSLPVFFATSILQWILIAKKQQVFLSVVYVVSAGINIALNIAFIPQFSYIASSVITGMSEFLVFIILWIKIFGSKRKEIA